MNIKDLDIITLDGMTVGCVDKTVTLTRKTLSTGERLPIFTTASGASVSLRGIEQGGFRVVSCGATGRTLLQDGNIKSYTATPVHAKIWSI